MHKPGAVNIKERSHCICYRAHDYRFGFNGQEKDDEITGVTGSHLDY